MSTKSVFFFNFGFGGFGAAAARQPPLLPLGVPLRSGCPVSTCKHDHCCVIPHLQNIVCGKYTRVRFVYRTSLEKTLHIWASHPVLCVCITIYSQYRQAQHNCAGKELCWACRYWVEIVNTLHLLLCTQIAFSHVVCV
jgi:hypothetical protein